MTFSRRSFVGNAIQLAIIATTGLGGVSAMAAKPVVMGFSQVGAESEWRTANTLSIKDAAKKEGVNLKFADAQQKQENQVKAIRSLRALGSKVKDLAAQFGVTRITIYRVIKRLTWSEVKF